MSRFSGPDDLARHVSGGPGQPEVMFSSGENDLDDIVPSVAGEPRFHPAESSVAIAVLHNAARSRAVHSKEPMK